MSMHNRNYSWLELVGFCVAVSFAAALGIAALVAGTTLGVAFAQSLAHPAVVHAGSQHPDSGSRTFSGVITDSTCGARHVDSRKSPEECARMCVRNSAKYVLVNGDKRYGLVGQKIELNKLLGQRANVNGTLDGDSINVNSVVVEQP
jgi:hypothetical protein